jgi:hypothetical protein
MGRGGVRCTLAAAIANHDAIGPARSVGRPEYATSAARVHPRADTRIGPARSKGSQGSYPADQYHRVGALGSRNRWRPLALYKVTETEIRLMRVSKHPPVRALDD